MPALSPAPIRSAFLLILLTFPAFIHLALVTANPNVVQSNPLDLVFLIEGSAAVSSKEFTKAVTMAQDVIISMPSSVSLQVAVLEYSTNVQNLFKTFTQDRVQMLTTLNNLPPSGGTAYTGSALSYVKNVVVPSGRSGVSTILVVFTATNSIDNVVDPAMELRSLGWSVFAVGLGSDMSYSELVYIAGPFEHVSSNDEFDPVIFASSLMNYSEPMSSSSGYTPSTAAIVIIACTAAVVAVAILVLCLRCCGRQKARYSTDTLKKKHSGTLSHTPYRGHAHHTPMNRNHAHNISAGSMRPPSRVSSMREVGDEEVIHRTAHHVSSHRANLRVEFADEKEGMVPGQPRLEEAQVSMQRMSSEHYEETSHAILAQASATAFGHENNEDQRKELPNSSSSLTPVAVEIRPIQIIPSDQADEYSGELPEEKAKTLHRSSVHIVSASEMGQLTSSPRDAAPMTENELLQHQRDAFQKLLQRQQAAESVGIPFPRPSMSTRPSAHDSWLQKQMQKMQRDEANSAREQQNSARASVDENNRASVQSILQQFQRDSAGQLGRRSTEDTSGQSPFGVPLSRKSSALFVAQPGMPSAGSSSQPFAAMRAESTMSETSAAGDPLVSKLREAEESAQAARASTRTPQQAVHYTLEELKAATPPEGVDRSHRESYLSDGDFARAFGMSKPEFYALPAWKQGVCKKRIGLF